MTKKIYKKSVLLSAVVLISFFSLAYGSTVELQPIADGYFDYSKVVIDVLFHHHIVVVTHRGT